MTDRYQSYRNAPQKPTQKPVKSLFDEAVESLKHAIFEVVYETE